MGLAPRQVEDRHLAVGGDALVRAGARPIAYTAFGAFQLVALLVNGSSMTGARWGYGLVLAVVLATGAHGWWTTGRSGPVAYDRPGPPSTTAGRTGRGS
jgi:hypothetical protein